MNKKGIIFILFIIFIFHVRLKGAVLIECDTKPNNNFKAVKSIALFPFDSRLVNSGRSKLIDSIKLSNDLFEYMLKKFQSVEGFTVSIGKGEVGDREGDRIKILRSSKLKEYDEKVVVNKEVVSHDTSKTIDAVLYGKINRYYEGRDFDTGYIDVTIYLVDSKSKVVYWTTKIRGCLKYVVQTIVGTVTSGEYSEPTVKETSFDWVNPYNLRARDFAFEYSRPYNIMLPDLSNKVENGWGHKFTLYFKSPLFESSALYNEISLSILYAFKATDENDKFNKYKYYTFLPLTFDFVYNFYNLTGIKNLRPYAKLGFGVSYDMIYYSGYTYELDSHNSLNGILNIGMGAEYFWDIGTFYLWKLRVSIKRLGVSLNINYMKWVTEAYAGLNLGLGIKYYF